MDRFRTVALLLVIVLVVSFSITACDKTEDSSTSSNKGSNEQVKNNDKNNEDKDKDNAKKSDLAEKQELRVILTDNLPNLDPQLCTDTVALEILQDILEGLIRLDQDGTVKKDSGMAKDWDISEDGKVYTFHIREAFWSDGVPVTAEDFEYSWKRLLNPKTESKYAFIAYDIENAKEYSEGYITDSEKVGVKAIDKNTLEVRLKAANSTFVSKLQHSSFLPSRKDLVEKYGDRYGSEAHLVPSCGPFMIDEWYSSRYKCGSPKLILVKNPLYWDVDVVKLEEVLFIDGRASSSLMGMYITGQTDYQSIPSQFIERYKNQVKTYYEGSSYYYVFNIENKYVSNPKIRKAIRMAIDQRKVFEIAPYIVTNKDPAYAFVPPGITGYDGKTFREIAGIQLFNDVGTGATEEDIKTLVEEGLAEQGMILDDIQGKITYLTNDSDYSLRFAEIYRDMIEEYTGIKIGIEQTSSIFKSQKLNDRDFIFSSAGWIADYNDAMTFMDIFLSESPYNYANFSNDEYDAYITKAKKSYDSKVRIDSMIEAEKILIDNMPIAPRLYVTKRRVQKPYVKNLVRIPLQIYSGKKWAYILKH